MTPQNFLKDQVQGLLDLAGSFLTKRQQKAAAAILNEMVRDIRISIHCLLTNHFLHFSHQEADDFCHALHDRLLGTCGGQKNQDHEYNKYFIQSLMLSFEWAQQIKHDVENDPATQKILLLDIPILRPFHYGTKQTPTVPAPKKRGKHPPY